MHSEGPNVDDPEVMWEWISAYHVPFYDTFWTIQGMKEYEYIYGATMEQDVSDILALADAGELSMEELKKYLERAMPHCSVHFGQIYPNLQFHFVCAKLFLSIRITSIDVVVSGWRTYLQLYHWRFFFSRHK